MVKRSEKAKRLLVPIVLTVSVVGAAIAATSSSGCGEDKPRIDASTGDAPADTPIV